MRFSLGMLLILVANAAFTVYCVSPLTGGSYLTCCIVVPTALALGFRFAGQWSKTHAALLAWVCATVLGSLLLGYGSFHKTYVEQAQGFLIGHWSSIVVSMIVGLVPGSICGLLSLAIYWVIASAFPIKPSETRINQA
ncbi:MAG: hypothetical protein JNK57_02840 [Planctomycetaceae bacterium]|nr:hypothetical protein [Planctomycetaceae bacterium]